MRLVRRVSSFLSNNKFYVVRRYVRGDVDQLTHSTGEPRGGGLSINVIAFFMLIIVH